MSQYGGPIGKTLKDAIIPQDMIQARGWYATKINLLAPTDNPNAETYEKPFSLTPLVGWGLTTKGEIHGFFALGFTIQPCERFTLENAQDIGTGWGFVEYVHESQLEEPVFLKTLTERYKQIIKQHNAGETTDLTSRTQQPAFAGSMPQGKTQGDFPGRPAG